MKHLSLILALGLAAAQGTQAAEPGAPLGYSGAGDSLTGWRVEADDPRGVAVVFPTSRGISEMERDRAMMLAGMGFTTLAADMHGDGALPASPEEAQAGLERLLKDRDRLRALVAAALEASGAAPDDTLVVMGYSMGGLAAMEAVYSGIAAEAGVDAIGVFSGRITDHAGRMLPEETAPLFIARGGADARIPAEELWRARDELEMAEVPHEIHFHEDAGHLFTAPGFPNHRPELDAEVWAAWSAFLDARLD